MAEEDVYSTSLTHTISAFDMTTDSTGGGATWGARVGGKGAGMMSVYTRDIVIYFTYVGLCGPMSLGGIVSNIINMAVFWRHGFTESVNVALFALSVFDLITLVFFLWTGICLSPDFAPSSDTTAFVSELHLVMGGAQRMNCIRTSVWVMALISMERCTSILLPLKVKKLFTPKRTVIAIGIGCLMINLSSLSIYLTVYVGERPVRGTNRTRSALIYTKLSTTANIFMALVIQSISLGLILVSNTLLVVALRKRHERWQGTNKIHPGPSCGSFMNRSQDSDNPSSAVPPQPPAQHVVQHHQQEERQQQQQLQLQPEPQQQDSSTNNTSPTTETTNCGTSSLAATVQLFQVAPANDDQVFTTNSSLSPTYPQERQTLAVPARGDAAARSSTEGHSSEYGAASSKSGDAMTDGSSKASSKSMASQTRKLGKMVVMLSAIQLLSFLPSLILFALVLIDPKIYSLSGRYANLLRSMWGVIAVFEAFNASTNIFVYYNMSSRYRQTFQSLMKDKGFKRCRQLCCCFWCGRDNRVGVAFDQGTRTR